MHAGHLGVGDIVSRLLVVREANGIRGDRDIPGPEIPMADGTVLGPVAHPGITRTEIHRYGLMTGVLLLLIRKDTHMYQNIHTFQL